MIEKTCQSHKYNLCYDATKLKKMVKFYVPTWTLFAGPVTKIMVSYFLSFTFSKNVIDFTSYSIAICSIIPVLFLHFDHDLLIIFKINYIGRHIQV